MVPTFVIFLREGVEASMIVSILLAYLDKLGQRRYFRDVFVGVGAAFVLILAGGAAAWALLTSYAGSRVQTIFETATYLVAAVVLTYMTFWMQGHSRSLSSDLRRRAESALDGRARWGLRVLAFQAVGREGVETMVFTLAIVFASSGRGVIAGGLAGLAAALVMAVAIYRLGRRVDMGRFFTVVGALLMVFAAALLADAMENLQELGWVPVVARLWNTRAILPEGSNVGDLLHVLFGYADQPSALQVGVYGLYLALAVGVFLARRRTTRRPARAAAA